MTGCPAELASGRLGAHLDFFDATGETAQLASGILGTFPLLWLATGLRRDYVDLTTRVGRGIVAGGGDVGIRGGRAREEKRLAWRDQREGIGRTRKWYRSWSS